MILSGQTIREFEGMLYPFEERTVHSETGMSFGLSCSGYDIRIAQDVFLPSHGFVLASSIERFDMPLDVVGEVKDKSSLARRGISVFNTVIEPGWRGYLTLEIANHSGEVQQLLAGQPIAQVLFRFTDKPVERPYMGKYQDQPNKPVNALKELPAR